MGFFGAEDNHGKGPEKDFKEEKSYIHFRLPGANRIVYLSVPC